MKKLTALFLALVLLCSLAGCDKQQSARQPDDDSPGSSNAARPEPPRAPGVSDAQEDEPEDAAGADAAEQAKDFLGAWNDTVYSNELLGLNYTLPAGWEYASDEDLLGMVDIAADNDLLSDQTKLSAELSKSRMVYGMFVQDPASGSNVQVMFLNLEGLGEISEEECARQMAAQQETIFSESSGVTVSFADTYRAQLGGKDFLVLPIGINMPGVEATEHLYIRLVGDYGVMVAITALAGNDIETMEGGVSAFAPLNGSSHGASGTLTATGDIGRTFSTMFFDYTVVWAESPAEYDGYTPADGNKLLVVGVKVKNDFGSTLPMFDTDFQIQWGAGDYDYAWAVDAFNDDMMPLQWELPDGEEVTYDMLFEVPAGENDFSLVYLEEYTDRNGNDQTGDLYSANFTLLSSSAA